MSTRDNRTFADAQSTWDARYDKPEYIFGKAPNAFLARQKARLARGTRALCIADGEGRNSVWLAAEGLRVDAFDVSPVGVDKARRLAAERGVTVSFNLCDIDAWTWQANAYDVVAAIFFQFADPAQRARIFAGIVRTLAPGGWLFLEGYTPKQLDYKTGGPSQIEHLYTPVLLRESFAALDIVELVEYEEEVDEGPQHRGRSALIDLVARKAR